MKTVGVIPARFGSTRFPGKPLKKILDKPLLQWVVERSRLSKEIDHVLVATDDSRIEDLCKKISVDCVMTSADLPSGSDRVWAAVQTLNCDVVLNIQGDEPLIESKALDDLARSIKTNKDVQMATLGRPMTHEALLSLNTAKIVLNRFDEALYFSRSSIPHSREQDIATHYGCLKHVGIYAYRKSFLKEFCECGVVDLERFEGLEQLRALYLGAKIKVVKTDLDSWGVDTPEDVVKVEEKLRQVQNRI